MAEYIVDCNKELPEECEHCSPCLKFGCEHVTMATARQREEIVRCMDCKFLSSLYQEPVEHSMFPDGVGVCELWKNFDCEVDGFCAWGVKRSRKE